MLKLDVVMSLIGRWGGTLKYFPSDPAARLGIAEQLASMCADEDQIRWLVKTLPGLYNEWPGMREIRGLFCMKFRPLDGIEADSEVYPEGLTREQLNPGVKALPAAQPRRLEAGESITDDPEMKALVLACEAGTALRFGVRIAPELVSVEPGETDYQALLRHCNRYSQRVNAPRAAAESDIERVKAAQEANLRSREA